MTQPRRTDEIALYAALRAEANARGNGQWGGRSTTARIVRLLDIPDGRADYLLEKWYGKGWIECGTSVWSGWFTDAAPQELIP